MNDSFWSGFSSFSSMYSFLDCWVEDCWGGMPKPFCCLLVVVFTPMGVGYFADYLGDLWCFLVG